MDFSFPITERKSSVNRGVKGLVVRAIPSGPPILWSVNSFLQYKSSTSVNDIYYIILMAIGVLFHEPYEKSIGS